LTKTLLYGIFAFMKTYLREKLMTDNSHKPVKKAQEMLAQHQLAIIQELDGRAFDLLTPRETAAVLGIDASRIPDLIRQKWLEGAPGKKLGSANQYYRWRVEFVKRYRGTYKPKEKSHEEMAKTDAPNT
jgi:hypothetical protein